MKPTFDLETLRSFVAGIELGSFAKAADRLGRSTSAVSAQIKKLEDHAGTPIFRKAGRGLALTQAGETMLSYARRLLDLNDEAATALRGMGAEGWLRVGMQQDFGEGFLPKVLGCFARAHPRVRIEARVARNAELLDRVTSGKLDFALAWNHGGIQGAHRTDLAQLPVRWIGPSDARLRVDADEPFPLISYEDSCWFCSTGTAALDRIGQPWRVTLTSPNLSGLWAGVEAGLGLTVRTPLGLPATVKVLDDAEFALPLLPTITLSIFRSEAELDPVAEKLVSIVAEEIGTLI